MKLFEELERFWEMPYSCTAGYYSLFYMVGGVNWVPIVSSYYMGILGPLAFLLCAHYRGGCRKNGEGGAKLVDRYIYSVCTM